MVKTLATKAVSAANTATALIATRTAANSLILTAGTGNTASIWVGDSSALSANSLSNCRGTPLTAGSSITFAPEVEPNGLDLAGIYFSSSDGSAIVHITYIEG